MCVYIINELLKMVQKKMVLMEMTYEHEYVSYISSLSII